MSDAFTAYDVKDLPPIRMYQFLLDLTDPEKWGLAINSEIRKAALELLELYK